LIDLKKELLKIIEKTNNKLIEICASIGYDTKNEDVFNVHKNIMQPLNLNEKIDIVFLSPEAVIFTD
jgi:hypothetical protein